VAVALFFFFVASCGLTEASALRQDFTCALFALMSSHLGDFGLGERYTFFKRVQASLISGKTC
jgi:hypothetical protein